MSIHQVEGWSWPEWDSRNLRNHVRSLISQAMESYVTHVQLGTAHHRPHGLEFGATVSYEWGGKLNFYVIFDGKDVSFPR